MGSDAVLDMETVSLNDDDATGSGAVNPSSSIIVDSLDAQPPVLQTAMQLRSGKKGHGAAVIEEDVTEDDEDAEDAPVVVVVDQQRGSISPPEKPRLVPPSLPPLRVVDLDTEFDDDRDYVDPTLFSPEVSRHSMEQAHRRARSLESELKELSLLEGDSSSTSSSGSGGIKITPTEAVSIISGAFVSSVSRVRQLVSRNETEYDLLSGMSPSSKPDDLDRDGDGLQLSPDGGQGDGSHFQSPRAKPALKRISAYSHTLDSDSSSTKKQSSSRRKIQWHDDVLDQDEEFVEDDEMEDFDGENESLMVNGAHGSSKSSTAISERQGTPRSRKKRKKMIRSVMRRLTPREKEELYRQRPDLMIVPNWAQKYREEMTDADSSRWGFWLIVIIGTLMVLLVILVMLIASDRAEPRK